MAQTDVIENGTGNVGEALLVDTRAYMFLSRIDR
jgi:hypothetical protein